MNKKNIGIAALIIWIVIATGYSIYDIWNDYKVAGVQRAYQEGVQNTVNSLIQQTEGSNCQPIDVFSGEKKIQVLDAKCASQQVTEAPAPVAQPKK